MMTPTALIFAIGVTSAPDVLDDPDPEVRERARDLRDEAYRRLLEDDYAGGIERLEAAYAEVPNPGLLLNVLIAYRRWPGHCEDAYATYERFDAVCDRDCPYRPDGAEQLAALDAKCAAAVTFIAPVPAELFVDGMARGPTPATVRLRPGPHVVETATGTTFTVRVVPERPQSILLGAEAPPAPPPSPRAGRDLATFGLAGLGAGALVLGATFTGLAVDSASTLNDRREAGAPPEEITRLGERQDRDAAVAVVGWSVAAAAGTAALILWLTRPDRPGRPDPGPTEASTIGPRVAVGLGSLELRF